MQQNQNLQTQAHVSPRLSMLDSAYTTPMLSCYQQTSIEIFENPVLHCPIITPAIWHGAAGELRDSDGMSYFKAGFKAAE